MVNCLQIIIKSGKNEGYAFFSLPFSPGWFFATGFVGLFMFIIIKRMVLKIF
jgi:hypothetical protein